MRQGRQNAVSDQAVVLTKQWWMGYVDGAVHVDTVRDSVALVLVQLLDALRQTTTEALNCHPEQPPKSNYAQLQAELA